MVKSKPKKTQKPTDPVALMQKIEKAVIGSALEIGETPDAPIFFFDVGKNRPPLPIPAPDPAEIGKEKALQFVGWGVSEAVRLNKFKPDPQFVFMVAGGYARKAGKDGQPIGNERREVLAITGRKLRNQRGHSGLVALYWVTRDGNGRIDGLIKEPADSVGGETTHDNNLLAIVADAYRSGPPENLKKAGERAWRKKAG